MDAKPRSRWDQMTDRELTDLVKQGETDAFAVLSSRYLPAILGRAGRYSSIVGVETEDFVQEGLLALYRAAKGYDPGAQIQFNTYAITCIRNSMSNAIKRHYRQSRQNCLLESVSAGELPPEDQFFELERSRASARYFGALLSRFERQILILYLQGHTYQQISQVLSTTTKAVDNALQRVRRKLRGQL